MKNKKFAISISLLIAGLFPITSFAKNHTIHINNAWIQEAPPMAKVNGGFMTIMNKGEESITVSSVESPSFKKVQIHKSEMKDGMASMAHQKSLDIPAKSKLELKHGSYHLMLMGPHKRVMSGEKVEIIFHFSNGKKTSIKADVRKKGPATMDHSSRDMNKSHDMGGPKHMDNSKKMGH